jgi:hypothetical protein
MIDIEFVSINKPDTRRAAQILGRMLHKALLKKQLKAGGESTEKSHTFEKPQKK